MDGNGFLCIIFFFLIASDCSSAYNFRKLIGAVSMDGSNETDVSPSPSPVSSGENKGSKANPVDGGKSEGKKHEDSKSPNPVDGDSHLGAQPQETCDGSTNRCSILETLTGCIKRLETGAKDWVLLIQNEGGSTVKVNVTISASWRESYEILKHRTEGINVSHMIDGNIPTTIVLQVGNRDCLLQIGPHQSKGDFLQRFPSYYNQLSPIYGAYLLFLIALIVGGTWAGCKIRKRKRHDGVPYQELEMGVAESASAVNLESAEGWDDGWDDDWDEDKAVKSPGVHHAGSCISSTGLTARPANKDG